MGKQEHICIQCFSCKTFQAIIVSKKNKFKCKICGENQTVRKIYAISDQAKDIRLVVQDLNLNRPDEEPEQEIKKETVKLISTPPEPAEKWKEFLDEEDENEDEKEDDPRYTTLDPSMQKKKRKRNEENDFQIVFESKKKNSKIEDYEISETKPSTIKLQTQTTKMKPKKVEKSNTSSKWGDYLPESSEDE
jgi:hypothetical protein